ncbi:MAG TPA: hypothetical protein VK445_08945 [Dissulfurispiraceae bacterium]|nr:hypothetical protein [Dissulfurispiraceae bacterium]
MLTALTQKIEGLFRDQKAFMDVHYSDNKYKEAERVLANRMLNPHVSAEERFEAARSIIGINVTYREKILHPLVTYQQTISEQITACSHHFLHEAVGVPSYATWLSLAKKTCENRSKLVMTVRDSIEMDTAIPMAILEKKGYLNESVSEEDIMRKSLTVQALLRDSLEIEHALSSEREKIAMTIFQDRAGKQPDSLLGKIKKFF